MTSRISHYTLFTVLWCFAPLAAPPLAPADTPDSAKSIATELRPFVNKHALAGAVTLVADKDKILSLETVGYADVAAKKPMTPDTLFWIASQTKAVTATALMMLVDEGKVKVEDPVAKYLPEFKDQWVKVYGDDQVQLLKKPKHPVTVRHVLSHTSGLSFRSAVEIPTLDLLPLPVAMQSYVMTPLHFEPGSKWEYSNPGINIAGRIIEVVSHMPYDEFMRKRLFEPLGMKDTTFWPAGEKLQRLAKSYKPNAAKNDLVETNIVYLKYPLDDRTRQAMPAGGLFATATDISRFCQMVLNGGTYQGKRYLSKEAVKTMTSVQIGDPPKRGYGLGWSIGWNKLEGVFGHGGAYGTDMTIDRKNGRIFVFMVQHNGFPKDGAKSKDVFQQAARERFGNSRQ